MRKKAWSINLFLRCGSNNDINRSLSAKKNVHSIK
ncbi:hypothetical protein J471_4805, partial [Acinetobacter baumannii 1032359]